MRDALDAYIAVQPDSKLSRSEAIRALLRDGLAGKGLMATAEPKSELNEEIAALEANLASIPHIRGQSPEAALHTMDRAIAENELVELRHKRKRLRKPPGKRS